MFQFNRESINEVYNIQLSSSEASPSSQFMTPSQRSDESRQKSKVESQEMLLKRRKLKQYCESRQTIFPCDKQFSVNNKN